MKEDSFKNIIEKSRHSTSHDFTDQVLAKIDSDDLLTKPLNIWSFQKTLIFFIGGMIGSGFLLYQLVSQEILSNSVLVPLIWSLLLLIGLQHLLMMNKYQTYLNLPTTSTISGKKNKIKLS
jgi:hypothetical protein